jgi:peptide/nickel transport system permease protein
MLELICKRLLLAVPTLLLVSMMVFGLQKLLPGDPLIAMAGEERDPAVIARSLTSMRRSPCSISTG